MRGLAGIYNRRPLSDGPDRISELGSLLALALIRRSARNSSEDSAVARECSLDFAPPRSGNRDRSPEGKGHHV